MGQTLVANFMLGCAAQNQTLTIELAVTSVTAATRTEGGN